MIPTPGLFPLRGCLTCGRNKPAIRLFFGTTSKPGGKLQARCKRCLRATRRGPEGDLIRARMRAYNRRTNPKWPGLTNSRRFQLWSHYEMRPDDYLARMNGQGMRCAICRAEFKTLWGNHVDHCHATGRVCGVLCERCNVGIGMLGESSKTLLLAAAYVRREKEVDDTDILIVPDDE